MLFVPFIKQALQCLKPDEPFRHDDAASISVDGGGAEEKEKRELVDGLLFEQICMYEGQYCLITFGR